MYEEHIFHDDNSVTAKDIKIKSHVLQSISLLTVLHKKEKHGRDTYYNMKNLSGSKRPFIQTSDPFLGSGQRPRCKKRDLPEYPRPTLIRKILDCNSHPKVSYSGVC